MCNNTVVRLIQLLLYAESYKTFLKKITKNSDHQTTKGQKFVDSDMLDYAKKIENKH